MYKDEIIVWQTADLSWRHDASLLSALIMDQGTQQTRICAVPTDTHSYKRKAVCAQTAHVPQGQSSADLEDGDLLTVELELFYKRET